MSSAPMILLQRKKAAAHLWTELYRRRNNLDQMHHWQKIPQKLDPTAAYKIFRAPTPAPTPFNPR